jgi:REP element-mobilizing transposase RayT
MIGMARYYTPQMSDFPYHVTARCPNREQFPLPISEIWKFFEHHLSLAHYKNGLRIHTMVLMPNHFHLICSTDHFAIGKVMSELLGGISKDINRQAGKINQNWGGRHYKCVLGSPQYFLNCYKYVYQNPLRARLCEYTEDWRFSTLHGLIGLSRLQIPLEPDTILFNPDFDENELKWLNRQPTPENLQAFRKSLQKREFKLAKVKRTQAHFLESQRL